MRTTKPAAHPAADPTRPAVDATLPARPLRRRGAARVISESAPLPGPVLERPDGWYWLTPDARQQFGPFGSQAEALADRDRGDEEAPAEGETLGEAESELGLADWIDPETGALAEGQAHPRLDEPR